MYMDHDQNTEVTIKPNQFKIQLICCLSAGRMSRVYSCTMAAGIGSSTPPATLNRVKRRVTDNGWQDEWMDVVLLVLV